jgi:hypothetical protein
MAGAIQLRCAGGAPAPRACLAMALTLLSLVASGLALADCMVIRQGATDVLLVRVCRAIRPESDPRSSRLPSGDQSRPQPSAASTPGL